MTDIDGAAAWVVVMTKVMAEEVVAKHVLTAGYRVYLPRYRKIIRGTRTDEQGKRTRPRGESVMRPLFPGYLFAELHPEQGWSAIRKANGVADLIWRGERPALLHAAAIETIREAERAGVFDEARPCGKRQKRQDIKIGDQVRVIDGPFAGFIGELVRLDENARAAALLSVFGRDTPLDVDQDALELVPA